MLAMDNKKMNEETQSTPKPAQGVNAGTLALACIFVLILSLSCGYFISKRFTESVNQQKIVTLDTQKLLNAEIKALFNEQLSSEVRESENKRFAKDLQDLIGQYVAQGYVIVQKDAVITGGKDEYDLTNIFISKLVTRPPNK